MRDYEEIVDFLSEYGPYQRLIFLLLSASILPNGFCGFSIVFVGDVPEHHCSIPGNLNLSEAWMNRTIPLVQGDDPHYSKCSRYRLDVIMNLSDTFPDPDFINMSGVEQEPCLDGWEYSREQYISTIVSEWDLVCHDDWKSPLSASVYFAGVLVGSLISGQLSDKFGRKAILFGTMAVQCVFSIFLASSPNWEIFCLLNFIVGMGEISNYMAAFVLGTELLGKSIRIMFCTLGVCISYSIGYMLLPLLAYYIRRWRMLLLALSSSCLLYIPLWWFIPESPRWLMLKGRSKEAEEILRYIAKKNGVIAPDVIFSDLELEDMKAKSTQSHTIINLVKTNNIRSITIICVLLWMTIIIGYFGLSLNTPNLHGNNYLNCFLSAAIEIPAYIASWLFLRRLSRRFTLSSTLLLGGAVLLLIQFIPSDISGLVTVLVMTGKLASSCGFAMIYVYTAELYPTAVRNMGIGVSSMVSRMGSIFSPYIFYLGIHHEFLPYILIGSMTALSGILVLLLPETFNHPLPDTIEQMQNIKMKMLLMLSSTRLWDLVCNDDWKSPLSASLYFAGMLVGSFISGQLSDKFGRKTILFGTMAVQCVFSIFQAFSPNWEIFCLLNFLVGMGGISNYIAAFVLGTELLGKSIRIMFCTLGVCISCAIGYMFLPFLAYFIRSWRMLLLALSVIGPLYIPLWCFLLGAIIYLGCCDILCEDRNKVQFIPESPRWLMLNGKSKEAEEIFRYIAKKNGVMAPHVIFSDLEISPTIFLLTVWSINMRTKMNYLI